MAVTYVNFVPSAILAPTYQITLDGNVYTLIMTWNLYAQRYYMNLYALDGTLIVAKALIGSPTGTDIASLSWANGKVTAITEENHGLTVNATVNVRISGVTPDGYNGNVQALVIDRETFSYQIPTDPGAATVPGVIDQNINLVGGYFTESQLVYRTANAQFEVIT